MSDTNDLENVAGRLSKSEVLAFAEQHGISAQRVGSEVCLYDSAGKPYIYVKSHRMVGIVTYDGTPRHQAALAAGATQQTSSHRNNSGSGFRVLTLGNGDAAAWLAADLERLKAGNADRASD